MIKIEGYENYYVTEDGVVINDKTGKALKQQKMKSGYLCVNLTRSRTDRKKHLVHRLVAAAFVPNPKPEIYNIVNHINGKRFYNKAENLEWTDQLGNMLHAKNRGTLSGRFRGQGKLSELDVTNIRKLSKAGERVEFLASIYKVHENTIRNIKIDKSWCEV